jgi:hypothetical protein
VICGQVIKSFQIPPTTATKMNHSSTSTFDPSTSSEIIARQKRTKLVESLQKGKFSDFEGSKPLIDLLKKQRNNTMSRVDDLHTANRIIAKQQRVLHKLDECNVRLVDENTKLNKKLETNESVLKVLSKKNEE